MTTVIEKKKPTIKPKQEKDMATQTAEWMTDYRKLLRKRDLNDADRFGKLVGLLGRDVMADQSIIDEAIDLEKHADTVRSLSERMHVAEDLFEKAKAAHEIARGIMDDRCHEFCDLKCALGRCQRDSIKLQNLQNANRDLFG